MSKRTNKNKLSDAAVIAVVISLASCGRGDAVPETGATQSGATQFGQESAAQAVPASPDAIAVDASTDDPAEHTMPTLVERRHFAIYSAYRVLFDDSPDLFQSRVSGQREGLQQAVMTDDESLGNLPVCSMRAFLVP